MFKTALLTAIAVVSLSGAASASTVDITLGSPLAASISGAT